LLIESLVAVLLALTICYCLILNRRLSKLRADESSLRATIAELVTATEIAERAIAGLKVTVRDCDHTLGERLRTAERFGADLGAELKRGDEILARIIQITAAANGAGPPTAESARIDSVQTLRAENSGGRRIIDTAAAAQAIAHRNRSRSEEEAA
jgi:hypothetical protein